LLCLFVEKKALNIRLIGHRRRMMSSIEMKFLKDIEDKDNKEEQLDCQHNYASSSASSSSSTTSSTSSPNSGDAFNLSTSTDSSSLPIKKTNTNIKKKTLMNRKNSFLITNGMNSLSKHFNGMKTVKFAVSSSNATSSESSIGQDDCESLKTIAKKDEDSNNTTPCNINNTTEQMSTNDNNRSPKHIWKNDPLNLIKSSCNFSVQVCRLLNKFRL
jgi:hypothetical protein